MSTSRKLFISLSLAIALIDTLFITANYYYTRNSFTATLQDESDKDFSIYKTVLESTYNGLSIQATLFAADSRIQELFYQGKKALEAEGGGSGGKRTAQIREALYNLVAEPWYEATKKFDVRQFQFHLGPGSLSFLRVHQPNKFGDSMDDLRFIIVDTNIEQTPRTGFETGRVSSGLRSVVPVFEWDTVLKKQVYIGALEIGTSYKKLLESIDQNINIQLSILLNKQHIKETVWEEFITGQYNNNTIDGCDCILEASSRPNQKAFLEHIATKVNSEQQLNNADGKVRTITYNNHIYAIAFHPLRDYLGTRSPSRADIGAVFIAKKIDQFQAAYKEGQLFNILYGIFAYFVVEFLLWLTFFNVTKHLTSQVNIQTKELSEQKNIIELDKLKYKNLADAFNKDYFFYTRNKDNIFSYVSPSITQVLGFSTQDFISNANEYLPHNLHKEFIFKKHSQPHSEHENKQAQQLELETEQHIEVNKNNYEVEVYNKSGRLQYLLLSETEKYNEQTYDTKIEGFAQDISISRRDTMQLELRCHILKLLSEKSPCETILTELALGIEDIIQDIHCTIMLLDQKKGILKIGAAPSLPAEFKKTLEAVILSSETFACAIAATTLKRKIIADLQEFSGKNNASELSEHSIFQACCSEPVLSSRAKMLATIDFYYTQTGHPSETDLSVIATASELASMIIATDP